MKQVHRLFGLLGLIVTLALSGCGGGSSSVTSAPAQASFASGGNNVVTMTVEPGPASSGSQPFNQPYVSVKICVPGGTCGTISGILVDTGSVGLRVMASALSAAGVNLPAMTDPNPLMASNTIQECLPFADGYAWGQVSSATISVGGETSSGSVPIQVINDASSPSPAVPSDCQSHGTALDGVDALGANGILGIGVFVSDCNSYCAQLPAQQTQGYQYYSCPSSGNCSPTSQTVADQVSNPVAYFPSDNNGVILQLPPISSSGAPTASGYLVFGIGTKSNNALVNAKVLTADTQGNFTTTFNGSPEATGFVDSGSNALFFTDSSLALCGNTKPDNEFYCPPSTTNLSAINQGANGTTSPVDFSIVDLFHAINGNAFAIDDTGGPAPPIPNFGPYFDWGLPFFYGRTVYFAIDGVSAGGTTGPYYAY